MTYFIFLCLAVISFVLTCIASVAVIKNKKKIKSILLTPKVVASIGIFISSLFMLLPIHASRIESNSWIMAFFTSAINAIKLFAFDGGYFNLQDYINEISFFKDHSIFKIVYEITLLAFHVVAPLLTFSVLLTFVKNIVASLNYNRLFRRKPHIFSELNEKSLALANSIAEEYKLNKNKRGAVRPLIVFTGVDSSLESVNQLIDDAKNIDAIIFSRKIDSFKLDTFHKEINFYLISDSESQKFSLTEKIIEKYDKPNISLYVFSDDIRLKLLLENKKVENMSVIRINDIQSLIYQNLDSHGIRLFANAKAVSPDKKLISAVIVGFGEFGAQMAKSLIWFCQFKGYMFDLSIIDKRSDIETKFRASCPALFDGTDKEKNYRINFYPEIDVCSTEFESLISKITDATYFFVSLGSDEINLDTSIKIRSITESLTYSPDPRKPDIETVIFDPTIADIMSEKWVNGVAQENTGIHSIDNNYYRIHMIGGLNEFYSVKVLINSKLNAEAYEMNKQWAIDQGKNLKEIKSAERDYYRIEYNYTSSITKAIHHRLKKRLEEELGEKIPGSNIPRRDILMDSELLLSVASIEHTRWDKYMRTNGYRYGEVKNHLNKRHPNLVSTKELEEKSPETLCKDI